MSMIASVLHLDRGAVQSLHVTDPYSLHRVVYSLYEDVRSENEKLRSNTSGILYADMGGGPGGRRVLLLANREPAKTVNGRPVSIESKTVSEGFLEHEEYRFKVTVNPTRRNNKTRKLEPVKGRQPIAHWFCGRAQRSWGFQVAQDHLLVDKVEVLQFTGKNGNNLTIAQAQLQGRLRVLDQEKFKNSFQLGIGRARAFGCGLLQIQPIHPSASSKGDFR